MTRHMIVSRPAKGRTRSLEVSNFECPETGVQILTNAGRKDKPISPYGEGAPLKRLLNRTTAFDKFNDLEHVATCFACDHEILANPDGLRELTAKDDFNCINCGEQLTVAADDEEEVVDEPVDDEEVDEDEIDAEAGDDEEDAPADAGEDDLYDEYIDAILNDDV